jgi:hypothetical protein
MATMEAPGFRLSSCSGFRAWKQQPCACAKVICMRLFFSCCHLYHSPGEVRISIHSAVRHLNNNHDTISYVLLDAEDEEEGSSSQ